MPTSAERFRFPTGGRTGNGRTERRHKAPNIKAARGGPGGRDPLARAGREKQAGGHFSTEELSKGGRPAHSPERGNVGTNLGRVVEQSAKCQRSLGRRPLRLRPPCRVAADASPLPSRLFFRERRAQSAGWTGCPRSAGVSAGRRLRLSYLMPWSLPGRRRHSPRIRPVTAPAFRLGAQWRWPRAPAGEAPAAAAAPGGRSRLLQKARSPEPARAPGAAPLGNGAARAPCWPGGTRAPSPGFEAPTACHPGFGRFQQARPQNTV